MRHGPLPKCETVSPNLQIEFLKNSFVETNVPNTFHKAVVLGLFFTILPLATWSAVS